VKKSDKQEKRKDEVKARGKEDEDAHWHEDTLVNDNDFWSAGNEDWLLK
jgi:hypothetical protein